MVTVIFRLGSRCLNVRFKKLMVIGHLRLGYHCLNAHFRKLAPKGRSDSLSFANKQRKPKVRAIVKCQQRIKSNSKLFRTILFLDAAASYNGKGVYANT
jgi:hypothetical protein